MHVVVNGWFYARPDVGSGQYVRRLISHLQRHPTHRFTVITPALEHRVENIANSGADEMSSIVRYVALPTWPKQFTKVWWEQILMPLMARRLNADLLWVPYWAGPVWQPCPTVVTVHDLIPARLAAYRGNLATRLYTRMVSYTARRAAAIITVSQASRREIVRHLRIPAEKVHVVYNGLDPTRHAADQTIQEIVRNKLQLPQHYFLYLGGFDVRKNVNMVLNAHKRYLDIGGNPDIQLVIAGRLPQPGDALHPDPREIVADLGLTAHVHFCGYVDESDKLVLCAMATAFVFPSLYEGFGLPIVEAMDAGTPVITSNR